MWCRNLGDTLGCPPCPVRYVFLFFFGMVMDYFYCCNWGSQAKPSFATVTGKGGQPKEWLEDNILPFQLLLCRDGHLQGAQTEI